MTLLVYLRVSCRVASMTYQRCSFMYRAGVSLKQYSTKVPHSKLTASSMARLNAIKTLPKESTELDEDKVTSNGSSLASDTDRGELHQRMARQRNSKEPNEVTNNEATGPSKVVPLYDAVHPGELEWKEIGSAKLSSLPGHYLMLAKFRLTSLVVLTSVGGYVMAPYPLEVGTLLALALGTGLISSAANAVNQFLEAPFDAQMARTRNRAIVRGLLTPAHAMGFAMGSAVTGACMLWAFTNPATTVLGLMNLFLYTSAYTPLKRITIANTWVGSIVGAIPPLMGWAACSGGPLDAGAWLMAGVLFSWQFPHFNALSWNLRQEYSRAGYRMMAVTNPDLCRKTALRYSAVMVGICLSAPVLDVTTWTFAFDSLPLNLYLTYLAWKFYKESDSRSSRNLFRFTLLHLPALMLLMLISKKHYSSADSASSADAVVPLVTTESTSDS